MSRTREIGVYLGVYVVTFGQDVLHQNIRLLSELFPNNSGGNLLVFQIISVGSWQYLLRIFEKLFPQIINSPSHSSAGWLPENAKETGPAGRVSV